MDGAGIGALGHRQVLSASKRPGDRQAKSGGFHCRKLVSARQISDLTAAKLREAAWIRRRVTIVLASAYICWQGAERRAMTASGAETEIGAIRQQLAALEAERQRLEARLRQLERPTLAPVAAAPSNAPVNNGSPASEKVALFRRLFGGRTDVFPARWENPKTGRSGYAPACANEWLRGVCGKPRVKCGDCPSQAFIPVTNEVIECHLRGEDRVRPNGRGGDFVAGVYPLLFDDTCSFLAVDFDDKSWANDARAFIATCREVGVQAALERSRSAHATTSGLTQSANRKIIKWTFEHRPRRNRGNGATPAMKD